MLQNGRKNAVKRVFGDLLSDRDFTSGAGYGYIECREVQFCGAIGKIKSWHQIGAGELSTRLPNKYFLSNRFDCGGNDVRLSLCIAKSTSYNRPDGGPFSE
ncbi:hypothetical protein [Serratia sarumanii]|uniref:hypothetical protein n=1 Tax=Serratia sarumanii TaxID=3020826 RepID=UPI003F7E9EFA